MKINTWNRISVVLCHVTRYSLQRPKKFKRALRTAGLPNGIRAIFELTRKIYDALRSWILGKLERFESFPGSIEVVRLYWIGGIVSYGGKPPSAQRARVMFLRECRSLGRACNSSVIPLARRIYFVASRRDEMRRKMHSHVNLSRKYETVRYVRRRNRPRLGGRTDKRSRYRCIYGTRVDLYVCTYKLRGRVIAGRDTARFLSSRYLGVTRRRMHLV